MNASKLALSATLLTLLAACSTETRTSVSFHERPLEEPAWLTETKNRICTARSGELKLFADAGAPASVTGGDAPCYLTSDVAGGGAIVDFTGDGLPDIVWTAAQLGEPVFLANRGDWNFEDVSTSVLPSGGDALKGANGMAAGDIDNDGDVDLFFTGYTTERPYLLVNDGTGNFSEEAESRVAGMITGAPQFGVSAVFGDYDNDGWLDLHTTESRALEIAERDNPGHARLLRNLGGEGKPGVFEDVTLSAGVNVRLPMGAMMSFVSAFHDYDGDGKLDLHVISDFNTSRIFLNNGDGTFRDGFEELPITDDESGMGLAIGDVTGDGIADVFVVGASQSPPPSGTDRTCSEIDPFNHRYGRDGTTGNRLYDIAGGQARDVTDEYGVRHSAWGWGAVAADFDNRGRLGLVTVASFNVLFTPIKLYCFYEDSTQPVFRLWVNDGDSMSESSANAGIVASGRPKSPLTADLDGDGDEDLVVFHSGERPRLFENVSPDARDRQIRIRFSGKHHRVNARIVVLFSDGSPELVRYAAMQNGLMAARFTDEIVGLGERANSIEAVRIEYVDGTIFTARDVSAGTVVEAP